MNDAEFLSTESSFNELRERIEKDFERRRQNPYEPLQYLVSEAAALGGGDLCAGTAGHDWRVAGGRACPHWLDDNCSQAVYECARCGLVDWGWLGGPGDDDCASRCTAGYKFKINMI